ncbi:hypothetical protein D9611_009871 [Ephemerocybe angulata]|uniref:Uncharacterized protein n=1 Tax=Ephemerocybe angulata TaxID=980116 RepID=A0A8H5CCS1_9AGAR|nr:hypothetical protein D9611_009871 [Tulosesus angulatus]
MEDLQAQAPALPEHGPPSAVPEREVVACSPPSHLFFLEVGTEVIGNDTGGAGLVEVEMGTTRAERTHTIAHPPRIAGRPILDGRARVSIFAPSEVGVETEFVGDEGSSFPSHCGAPQDACSPPETVLSVAVHLCRRQARVGVSSIRYSARRIELE